MHPAPIAVSPGRSLQTDLQRSGAASDGRALVAKAAAAPSVAQTHPRGGRLHPAADAARRPSAPTAYIVEDDTRTRDLIVGLVELHGCTAVAFDSAERLLTTGRLERPCCVILDIGLPGMGGLQLQDRLQREYAALPVIVVTGKSEVALARRALLAGAVDYLLKPVDARELLDAVTRSLASEEARMAKQLALSELQHRIAARTARERDVFHLVTDGLHNREIAAQLGVSVRTVEAHRANLMDKLRTQRTAEWFGMRAALQAP